MSSERFLAPLKRCFLARHRAHPLDLMEAQALSLGLPLLHVVIPKGADYKESYVSGMKKLKAGFTPPPQCDSSPDRSEP